jgi:hypothetical protein
MRTPRRNIITPAEKAERRKLAIMRASNTDTSNHYNLGGREKPVARKPSLPSAETLQKLDRDDGR